MGQKKRFTDEELKANARARYHKNKDRNVNNEYIRRYGITLADYHLMHSEQGGLCAICFKTPKRRLCIDHCHVRGKVRELLCSDCNIGIGHLRDNIATLESAINYIKRHNGDSD